jgi:cytochrome b subunit of formate dehydrogenase
MRQLASEALGEAGDGSGRVMRHALADRLYHWLMAVLVLLLMGTAFLPILGIKFDWVDVHWISGVLLALLIVLHMVRAVVWQDWRSMWLWGADIRDLWRSARGLFADGPLPARPGKYDALQKLYHLGIALLVLAVTVSGLVMLLKIDTPLWRRNPYWLSNDAWGVIYAVHGLTAMAMVTMVMIHVYFALRPDEWHLTRSMLRGWISRKEYAAHHDSDRWKA